MPKMSDPGLEYVLDQIRNEFQFRKTVHQDQLFLDLEVKITAERGNITRASIGGVKFVMSKVNELTNKK